MIDGRLVLLRMTTLREILLSKWGDVMKPLNERIRKCESIIGAERLLNSWADEAFELESSLAEAEEEINRAMNVMFPNGWQPDDAKALGQTVEGVCDTLAEARRENERLQERIIFEQACRVADAHHDYNLAAYMLLRLRLTKEAELDDLACAIHEETASKSDWEGLRDYWDQAYRDALQSAEEQQT